MARVAPIKLFYGSKSLWFDAGDFELFAGEEVVVTTARGTEFGEITGDVFEVGEEKISELKSPLKPVLRKAEDADREAAAEMKRKSAEALPVFKEMAAELNPDMRPVSVEYLLDGDKAVFYFEAEDRVDFRELVRKLAAHFQIRVDMRQIGVRDEARMVGGIGHCGQELCCKRLGGEFSPVSIRMAKEQDLSLNPQKISGVCGRLMCCLRYEYEAYKDFKSRAPKVGATIQTPEGEVKVSDLDVPREVVSLKNEEGKVVKVPLADFEPTAEGCRPCEVCAEAWEAASQQDGLNLMSSMSFATSQLTETDKLAEAGTVRHTASRGTQAEEPAVHDAPRKRRRSTKLGILGASSKNEGTAPTAKLANEAPSTDNSKQRNAQPKKRRFKTQRVNTASSAQKDSSSQKNQVASKRQASRTQGQSRINQQRNGVGQQGEQQAQKSFRPGRNSSGLRAGRPSEKKPTRRTQTTPATHGSQAKQSAARAPQQNDTSTHRVRRRSHRSGGGA